jgi:hypothetical protein
MPLPRYSQSQEIRLQRGTMPNAGMAEMAQANTWNTLSQKLDQWGQIASQEAQENAIEKGKQQAYEDQLAGVEMKQEDTFTAYGKAYNGTRKAAYTAQLQSDISIKSDEYATQYQDDPDTYKAKMDKYIETVSRESELPDIQTALQLDGNNLVSRQFSKLKTKQLEAIKKADKITYTNHVEDKKAQIVDMLVSGDTKGAELAMTGLESFTLSALSDGVISDAEYEAGEREFEYGVRRGVIKRSMQKLIDNGDIAGAGKMLEDFNEKIPEGMDLDQYEKLQSNLYTIYGRAKKTNDALLKFEKEEITNEVKDITAAINDGQSIPDKLPTPDKLALVSAEVRKKYMDAIEVSKLIAPYETLSITEQDRELANLRGRTDLTAQQVKARDGLEQRVKQRKQGWKKDPQMQGSKEGLYELNGVLSPNAAGAELVKTIKERTKTMAIGVYQAGNVAKKIFTESEANEWIDIINDPTTTVDTKMDLISTIEVGSGGNQEVANIMYSQIAEKGAGVWAYAGSLMRKGNTKLVKDIFRGEMVLKATPNLVDFQDLEINLVKVVGEANKYQSTGARKALFDTAKALFAARVEDAGDTTISDSKIKKVIKELTNGTGERNGQKYFLPTGIDADYIDEYIDDLTEDKIPEIAGLTKAQAIRTIQKSYLSARGDGKYDVIFNGNKLLNKETGKHFVLEIK